MMRAMDARQDNEALRDLNEIHGLGWTDRAIADRFGVSRTAVARWRAGTHPPKAPGMLKLALDVLRRQKAPGRARGGSLPSPAEDVQGALGDLHALGWSDAALAEAFGVSVPRASLWRRGLVEPTGSGMLLLAAGELKNREPPSGRRRARERGVRRPRTGPTPVTST